MIYCALPFLILLSEEWSQHRDDYGPLPTWDDENEFGGQFDDGDAHSDVEDSNALVSQPRQVGLYLFSCDLCTIMWVLECEMCGHGGLSNDIMVTSQL